MRTSRSCGTGWPPEHPEHDGLREDHEPTAGSGGSQDGLVVRRPLNWDGFPGCSGVLGGVQGDDAFRLRRSVQRGVRRDQGQAVQVLCRPLP